MKASQTKTKKDRDKSWIFILLLLLGVVFVYLSQTPGLSRRSADQQMPADPEHMKRVDAHLKDTAFNLESDRRQRQIEALQQLNHLHDSSGQDPYRESREFSLESDPNMLTLTQELDRSQQGRPDQQTPEEIVQQRLYENEQLKKENDAYREAYYEQFKENARRAGWEIELGPNYEVKSVRKIRRDPSSYTNGDHGEGSVNTDN